MRATWEVEFHWLRIRHHIKDMMNKEELPDLNTVLILIGIQESGIVKTKFSKEEKQDLMHVATCELLSQRGYFEFVGKDQDGWPHYKQVRVMPVQGADEQEAFLIDCIIDYFDQVIELQA